ncbi:MAG: DUF3592 domain-containing protein [Gammaproteobacteria bacterium]|nr:DUF3592 domain-containing protein [Gammaproteobacteria bacterium]
MFGPYTLIIIFFGLASLGAAGWSWRKIHRARLELEWPSVMGQVVLSQLNQDRLPDVQFQYMVAGETHQQSIRFSEDMVSAPDGIKHCLDKYPVGSQFPVHYQPGQINNYTLCPGPARDDRLVFIVSISGFLFALALIGFMV